MTNEEQRTVQKQLQAVHDQIHDLYPRGEAAADADSQLLRNRLLIVDLAVHLADEAVGKPAVDERMLVERAANLLFAVRLLAPGCQLEDAAELLLAALRAKSQEQ